MKPERQPDRSGDARPGGRRKRALLISAVSAGALIIVTALVLGIVQMTVPQPGAGIPDALTPVETQLPRPTSSGDSGSGDSGSGDSAPGEPATGTSAPKPSPGSEMDSRFGGVIASTGEIAQQVTTPGGLGATVTSVTPYTATAQRPGEVSGPAVKVALRLVNQTGAPFPLTTATVSAYYGSALTPAPSVSGDPAAQPFAGALAPGETQTAVYIFSVPETESPAVTLTLSDTAGAQLVVFQ